MSVSLIETGLFSIASQALPGDATRAGFDAFMAVNQGGTPEQRALALSWAWEAWRMDCTASAAIKEYEAFASKK